MRSPRLLGSAIAFLVLLLLAAPTFAQYGESRGNLFGKVVDEQGAALPGVTVTLLGAGAPRTEVTDARGEYRFVNLPPGTYKLSVTLSGFASLNRENVVVSLGKNTEITDTMKLSPVAATVTVFGESPIIDTRKVETGAAITQEELKSIPTSRDPWVILQTIPGVQIDRINVAGSESGQQSNFSSKGSSAGSFTVDGVNLTDMSALGASAGYYDFDSFQEMQVITGGSDPAIAGSGAHINMITKRGTNDLHGSARIFAVDHHFQSDNLPQEAIGQQLAAGNHIQSVQDYGVEAGGPVWKDHIWLWGAYGRDQINLVTAGGAQDKTTLENFNTKLDWQIVSSNTADVWYQRSDKLKFGRGAGPTHPQPTTFDQVLPQNTWKVQDSQVFSSSLFASASYSGQNGSFVLSPEGGLKTQTFIDANGVWANTYEFYSAPRPERQVKADVSYFFNTGNLGHELKAGFSYLKAGVNSTTIWPGDGSNGLAAQTYGDLFDCGVPCAVITRNGNFGAQAKYWSAFFGDTVTVDRLTINAGVRWDRQYGSNNPSFAPANPTFPQILPALNYPGRDKDFTWNNWQPRVGVTYAFGNNRNTLFKASYARYAEALGTGTVATTNNSAGSAYAYYAWNDANHNNLVEPGEVDLNNFQYPRNYDPANPGSVGTPTNGIDHNLKAPTTDEFIVGVDHELLPNFAVGVNYTHRKFTNLLYSYSGATALGHIYDPTTGRVLTPADYVLDRFVRNTDVDANGNMIYQLPDGTAYSVPVYAIDPTVLAALGGAPPGDFVHNYPDGYNQTYDGIEATMTKRLSNHWMVRGNFVWNNNKQHVNGGCIDPTNILNLSTVNAQSCAGSDYVSVESTGSGSKGSVFLNSKWQFNVVGMYQFPLGFNLATNVYGRQGYPINWFRRVNGPDGLRRDVPVLTADAQRYDNVYEVDMRVEKVSTIFQQAQLTLSVDCFNITNQNTVLQRNNRLGLTSTTNGTNTIREIQSPRIFRFGARISF